MVKSEKVKKNKKYQQKKNKKNISPSKHFKLFSIIVISISIVSLLLLLNKSTDLRTRAQGVNTCRCNDANRCFPDSCSRDNEKDPDVCKDNDLGPNMPAENNYLCYNPPDCCNRMIAANDAYKCCWVERGFCRKEQCNQLTGRQARCGWYWDDHSGEGYGCSRVVVSSEPSLPTKFPPTDVPTTIPTQIPTVSFVTLTLIPTSIPTIEKPIIFITTVPTIVNPTVNSISPTYYLPPTIPVISGLLPTPANIPTTSPEPFIKIIISDLNNIFIKTKSMIDSLILNILP